MNLGPSNSNNRGMAAVWILVWAVILVEMAK